MHNYEAYVCGSIFIFAGKYWVEMECMQMVSGALKANHLGQFKFMKFRLELEAPECLPNVLLALAKMRWASQDGLHKSYLHSPLACAILCISSSSAGRNIMNGHSCVGVDRQWGM